MNSLNATVTVRAQENLLSSLRHSLVKFAATLVRSLGTWAV